MSCGVYNTDKNKIHEHASTEAGTEQWNILLYAFGVMTPED
jgi:hypothetical protein